MPVKKVLSLAVTLLALIGMALMLVIGGRAQDGSGLEAQSQGKKVKGFDKKINAHMEQMMQEGRDIFRNDTFGDEAFWTDMLQLHKAIEGAQFGGVGPGVSPKTALAVGLKVDSEALPNSLVKDIEKGRVNLDDPATTLALIKLDAVVGIKGSFNQDGSLRSMGISCAVCHSTVDDSFAPGIGKRLDGWSNQYLNVGAIIALTPNLR